MLISQGIFEFSYQISMRMWNSKQCNDSVDINIAEQELILPTAKLLQTLLYKASKYKTWSDDFLHKAQFAGKP